MIDANAALERLKAGNAAYLEASRNSGDISQELIHELFEQGQAPFACVISCADSRVVPEHIFMTGLGELFCIRVAGNIVGDMELASSIYAAEHLHTPLIVVLGHTSCGAIASAMEAIEGMMPPLGHALSPLLRGVAAAIGQEKDPDAAAIANVQASLRTLAADPIIQHLQHDEGLQLKGALYHTDSGAVEFL